MRPNQAIHSSLRLENALREFFGANSSWYQSAGSFADAKEVRRAIKAVTKAIRHRLKTVQGIDARLAQRLDTELEQLATASKGVMQNGVGLLDVIAHLIELCAVLLGFDWQLGEANRDLQYGQSMKQIAVDDAKSMAAGVYEHSQGVEAKRAEMIIHLNESGTPRRQIALVMKVSERFVVDVLVRAAKATR